MSYEEHFLQTNCSEFLSIFLFHNQDTLQISDIYYCKLHWSDEKKLPHLNSTHASKILMHSSLYYTCLLSLWRPLYILKKTTIFHLEVWGEALFFHDFQPASCKPKVTKGLPSTAATLIDRFTRVNLAFRKLFTTDTSLKQKRFISAAFGVFILGGQRVL